MEATPTVSDAPPLALLDRTALLARSDVRLASGEMLYVLWKGENMTRETEIYLGLEFLFVLGIAVGIAIGLSW